ncbi:MAG: hypothetical protein WCI94_20540 [Rhodospirillales bacterium]
MPRLLRLRRLVVLPVLALGLAMSLGGCVVYPEGGYGRGYGAPAYYAAPVVAYDGGWGHHRHRDRW